MKTIYEQIPFIKGFAIAAGFSLLLLAIRILKTESIFFLFLVWNLFLASIPYAITFLLSFKSIAKYHLFFWLGFFVWLLFLPNAPYILTDLQHIRLSQFNTVWFDVLLITSFAINGLVIGLHSTRTMHLLLIEKTSKKYGAYIIYISLFLSGFGIYLGRVLRWNSWNVINDPVTLLSDIVRRIIHPIHHSNTWEFTFGFGGLLMVTYYLIRYYEKLLTQHKIKTQ